MPTKAVKRFTAWSFSRLNDYEGCAFRARLKHLDKVPEPPNQAMARGSEIHGKAEHYVDGTLKRLPKELKLFAEEFRELRALARAQEVHLEQSLAVDSAWNAAEWFARNTWMRAKVDVAYLIERDGKMVLVIIDHKTGKIRPEHTDQLELYALVGFANFSDADVVEARLWYLDQGEERIQTFTRTDVKALGTKWKRRTKKMLVDTAFKPTPSDHSCRWCPFKKTEGGQCRY